MYSSDIGSMPTRISEEVIWGGSRLSGGLIPFLGIKNDYYELFKDELVEALIDKIKVGVDVPNYPQFRDMNDMFFNLMTGFEKQGGALIKTDEIKAKSNAAIPEIEILKRESSKIREKTQNDRVKIKACVTGPYTLASFFQFKNPNLYEELGKSIASILRESIFKNKEAELFHVSIDEPVLGFMNDPLLDYGSSGRESLRKAWEKIAYAGKSHGLDVSMHLHNTSENLFWEVESLGIIASHVGDPLYSQDSTKKNLDEFDKHLWAPVSITQYDTLIQNLLIKNGFAGNIPEKIGEVWTGIRNGSIDPFSFLEGPELISKRLKTITDFFNERVVCGSPECGLNSFPQYDVALESLRMASSVIAEHGNR